MMHILHPVCAYNFEPQLLQIHRPRMTTKLFFFSPPVNWTYKQTNMT
uniref:Uncharacterized protein n=1 Tax=Rhizophora mucronata TaxID=61149 RepID=A0A2P2IS03_RHIMU